MGHNMLRCISRSALALPIAATLTFVPTSDDAMLDPHHKMATESSHGRSRIAAAPVDAEALGGSGDRRSVVGRAPLDDHALMCHGFAEGGASMGLGFWSIRYSISTQRPALRAPDGGAPLEPISAAPSASLTLVKTFTLTPEPERAAARKSFDG